MKKPQEVEIFLLIATITTIILVGITFSQYLELEQIREGTVIAKLAEHEDEVMKLDDWKILNVVQQNDVSVNQRLLMTVNMQSKWEHYARLYATIDIFQAGKVIDTHESIYSLDIRDARIIELPFFLKNQGPQDLSIELLFRNETNDYVFEQRVRKVYDLEVFSTQDKLLREQNSTLFWTQIATISATVGLVIVTWNNLRKSNKHTEEQLKLTARQLVHSETTAKLAYAPFISPRTMTIPQVGMRLGFSNIGSGSAKNIHLQISDPDSGNDIDSFDMFAMRPGIDEDRPTNVNTINNPRLKIQGTYQDIINNEYTINVIYNSQDRSIENLDEKNKKLDTKVKTVLFKISIDDFEPQAAGHGNESERKEKLRDKIKKSLKKAEGNLNDCKGILLSLNVTFRLFKDPNQTKRYEKDLDNLLKILLDVLPEHMDNSQDKPKGLGLINDNNDFMIFEINANKKLIDSPSKEGIDLEISKFTEKK